MRLKICRSVFIGEENILTKFRANPMHVVHVVHVHKCARGQILAIFRLMRLKICSSVFIGKDNILTKFRANPMHVVHVVRARMCTRSNFGHFSTYEVENL